MEDPIIKEKLAKQLQHNLKMEFQCQTFQKCKVWKPAGDALQLVVTDKEAPKAALDNAVKQIKGNIEANHSKKK